ncbi:MAG: molecular chaperone HtpG [Planctomycetota bacterium]
MSPPEAPQSTQYTFKAEVNQLLDILVHSVYTSKDIFVRELASNASDALEKVRFAKASGQEVVDPEAPEEIRITVREDGDRKILVISDTGIGMTEEELRVNLGTIAHSGASAFLEQLKSQGKAREVSLIGRFGIGFYSVFMVADRVVLTTRSMRPDAATLVWTSDGLGTYTIEPATEPLGRGTRIEIELKKDEERFADLGTIRSVIRRYSNFIPFPIHVDGEQANRTSALWRDAPHTIAEEKYQEFFQFLTYEDQPARLRLHLSVDVPIQFSALLFVPRTNPEALGFGEGKVSLQLYVKRVLIDGENENLLPKFLRFAKGVVESEDLPLSISRETLQENRLVHKIRETLTKKLLDELTKLAEQRPTEYAEFWRTFGRVLKEGYADFAYAERVRELLRFNTSTHADDQELSGLAGYVERAPETQTSIYYLTGPSREALERDPRLELFRRKGIEVIYLYDAADEFVLGSAGKYRDKTLVSADQASPEDLRGLGPDEGRADEGVEKPAGLELLIQRFKELLGERVVDVRVSERLVESPACLVSTDGVSGHLDRMMRMMSNDKDLPKRTLELNPKHALIQSLASMVEKLASDPFVTRACEQIFEGAMLADGYLTDPHRLVARMNEILTEAAAMRDKG